MRIKKTTETTPYGGAVVNTKNNSTNNTYSCDYINDKIVNVGLTSNSNFKTNIICGKNLVNNVFNSTTISGVTITRNDDGTLTLNGTATGTIAKEIARVNLKAGETYTLSAGTTVTVDTVRLDMRYAETGTVYDNDWYLPTLPTKTITNDIALSVVVRIQSGTTLTNKVIYPMLEKGSIATSYEEYVSPAIVVDNNEIYNKNDLEIYSTAEQRIGTYLGKPYYMITLTNYTLASETAGTIAIYDFGIDNNINIIEKNLYVRLVYADTHYYEAGFGGYTDNYLGSFRFAHNFDDGKIRVARENYRTSYSVTSMELTLKYTKTTD